ncbi:unnamed protein product [Prorocentrum cordatum]|uniref:Uncharacterized protein n=1 Tax=Prorocentrum cordatum TaxID=2364126 RepID=A0ABN9TNE4_9DINO|nr:unnamed protein product [Polarella glacialis]
MLALPFWEDVAVRALFWLALLIAVFVRIARSDSKEPMIAAGVLGGHVVGYAALETFGSVQRQAPFVEHVIPTVVASVSLYYLVLKATLWVADHLVHGSGEDTREQKIKAIDECEEDAFSFCNGFLISQVSKFYVLGFMPVLHGEPEGHSQQECDMLFGFVGLFSMIVCVLAALQELAHASGLPSTARLLFLAQHTAGMAAAWMLVFAGEWQWFAAVETPSLSSGIMLVTFVSTMVSFGLVVVLDFVAGRGWVRPASVRALIAIIATAVGLSWEKAFHEADQALTSGLSPKTATKCKLLLIVVVLLIVLQGWRYYVLPQAIEYEEKCEEKRKAEASQAEEGQKPAEVSEPQ